ncbi:MAG: hypothetical protein WCA15_15890 [Candidatus Acidiferrales bacterium]
MDEDSKDKPQQDSQNPAGTTSIMVANQHGHLREMQKDEKGRFIAKKKPLIPTIEFLRGRRKRLMQVKNNMTESMSIFEELLTLAHMEIPTDPKTGMPDAKWGNVKVQAIELIHLLSEGKHATSEQDLDRLTTQDVKTIIVVAPSLMHPEVIDADKSVEKKTQPTFAEVTDIKTNPKA